MRYLIYSDVHGNLPAFETVIKDAGKCDGYICLGDLVNYGPWSNECVDLALSLPNSVILMGNHEESYIASSYVGQNKLVNDFFQHTYSDFDRMNTIKAFLPKYQLKEFLCIHTLDRKNIYSDTKLDLDTNYIIGHSHHQFHTKNNGFDLYNTGSIGQNRKFINVANYLIFNSDSTVELKYCKFDVDYILTEMEKNQYPKQCILYYKQKELLL